MSVTFTDLQEAREYCSQKEEEGYYTSIEHCGKGRYKAYVGARERKGGSSYKGKGEIELSRTASTRTRLHEIGHKVLGHEPGEMPESEFASKEIDAEIFAYSKMDKGIDYRVGIDALIGLIDYGRKPKDALRIIEEVLKRKGVIISQEDKKTMLSYAEHYRW